MAGTGGNQPSFPDINVNQLRRDEHVHFGQFIEQQPVHPREQFGRLIGQFRQGAQQTAQDRRKHGRGNPFPHHVGNNQ